MAASTATDNLPSRLALIVEDEPALASLLEDTLREEGFRTEVLARGDAATEWVRRHRPMLVLLDLMLPGRDGFAVCREIREFSQVPLIMITARADDEDRLRGLDIGADDYICKPFNTAEVAARVRALLRRTVDWQSASPGSPLELDEACMQARWQNAPLDLTPIEFRLLSALGRRPGQVFSRAQLLDIVYVSDRVVSDRTIDSHVKNLRRKLTEITPDNSPIEAVYGVGYKFVG